MVGDDRRIVGDRGQVTIPKELRERFGLEGGDEVLIREADGRLVIEPPVTEEDLAEGYRTRYRRDIDLARVLDGTSQEADAHLGDAPEW